jgi:sugar phosphate isomerase/epimerase
MAFPKLGVQLIVFSKKFKINQDTDAVLDCVAKAGFKYVEGGASDARMYLEKLQARGLAYGGSHTTLKGLQNLPPLIEYLRIVGASDVCNSGLLNWHERTLADYQEAIKRLNAAGKTLRGEGIRLHYHNHDFEFAKVDGAKSGMDLLLDGLDPDACDLCVDVAWVKRGGSDPVEFLTKHNARIGYLHLKDFNAQGWIELGQGVVDFPAIMKVLPALTGVRWVMAEQDETKLDPGESAAISRKYLKDTFSY